MQEAAPFRALYSTCKAAAEYRAPRRTANRLYSIAMNIAFWPAAPQGARQNLTPETVLFSAYPVVPVGPPTTWPSGFRHRRPRLNVFDQLLFDQTEQMPVARHHVHLVLLPVARCISDINAQHKFIIAREVNAVHVPVTLPKLIERGCI